MNQRCSGKLETMKLKLKRVTKVDITWFGHLCILKDVIFIFLYKNNALN